MNAAVDSTFPAAPASAPAPALRRVLSRARLELVLLLRNGEQVLLTLVLPVLILAGLSLNDTVDLPGDGPRVARALPGVLALAVLSTAFTAQAIGTGFDRRYGVLRQVGVGPLGRSGLILAKIVATVAMLTVQVIVLVGEALLLGWSPVGSPFTVAALLLLGVCAFTGLALLLAGTLRAEATLALANLIYVLLLLGGGLFTDTATWPGPLRAVVEVLPSAALASGLRDVMVAGVAPSPTDVLILIIWGALGGGLAARFLKWD